MQSTRTFITAGLLAVGCGLAWSQTAPAQGGVAFGETVAQESLSDLRGGSNLSVTVNEAQLTGQTAGNKAIGVNTGTNTITDGALSHMTGIPVVVQNTGANVLIQNSVILNVQLAQ
jgi:hypothetical protein